MLFTFGDFPPDSTLGKAKREIIDSGPRNIKLSFSPAKTEIYRNDGTGTVLETKNNVYYVPVAENEAAVDSFIVHDDHLYLFQFTSSPHHGANRRLIDTLARLTSLPPPERRYFIFVVPQDLARRFSCPQSDSLLDRPYVAKIEV